MAHLSRYSRYQIMLGICLTLTLTRLYFEKENIKLNDKPTSEIDVVLGPPVCSSYICENQSNRVCVNHLLISENNSLIPDDYICTWPVFEISLNLSFQNFSTDDYINLDNPDDLLLSKDEDTLLVTGLLPDNVRLGNHLFNYASVLGIAHYLNRSVLMLPSPEMKAIFHLSYIDNRYNIFEWPMVRFIPWGVFSTDFYKLIPRNHTCICGYLQSWRYFQDISSEIRKEFSFNNSTLLEADNIRKEMTGNRSTEIADIIVGIHVRRGDLPQSYYVNRGYKIAPITYYLKAIKWMRHRFPSKRIHFFVVSEQIDLSWCQNHFSYNDVTIAPQASAAAHLALLASCDHVIMSVGSFGWWGAWLAGGYVIYYGKYIREKSEISRYFSASDYYLPEWISLED